jgi:GxxExxY protein
MFKADITPEIIGAAIKIHRKLGPGLLESAYQACLAYEIEKLGFQVQRGRSRCRWYTRWSSWIAAFAPI